MKRTWMRRRSTAAQSIYQCDATKERRKAEEGKSGRGVRREMEEEKRSGKMVPHRFEAMSFMIT
jgi:hypothetical protein